MQDKVFLDSNVIIYLYSIDEALKSDKCKKIVKGKSVFMSTQVLSEFSNVLLRRFSGNEEEVEAAVNELIASFTIYSVGAMTILRALRIKKKYKYSYYDSLIIAAALETDCNILYSEDLHAGQVIEDKLKIVNPFK